jgi:tRNA(Arg) A34 adenosine deaminase TadA
MESLRLVIALPPWCEELERVGERYEAPLDRMRVAIALSRRNVEEGSGGPFGAAIFEASSGRLVAVGVNSVVRLNNAVLHAETMAVMRASARRGSFTLTSSTGGAEGGEGGEPLELYTSCEPCAMCLGAILWSGLRRVIFAARRDDAEALGFDEGPVFPDTFAYLRRRGVSVEAGPLREEARAVLASYRAAGGAIYNG